MRKPLITISTFWNRYMWYYRLSAHSGNLRNEINRKKKIYFYDNGIRNALIGNYSLPDDRNDIGALWENYLMTERRKLLAYNGFYGHSFFGRSKAQAEVDYIEEIDGKLYAYEFKWNPNAKSKFPPSFIEAYKPAESKVIHFIDLGSKLSVIVLG